MSGAGDDLVVRSDLVLPARELHASFSRAGGPGGQNVNKVETRVTLRWSVAQSAVLDEGRRARLLARLQSRLSGEGELLVHASASRSQGQNLAAARERLALLVREALAVPRARKKSRPTRASRERRHEGKRRRSEIKRRRGRPSADD
jgi:ribosome-associated protein